MHDLRDITAALLGLALTTLALGCAQPRPFDDLWVDRRPYQSALPATRLTQSQAQGERIDSDQAPAKNPQHALSLHDAVALSLRQNPALKANGWSVAAAEADAMQMGRPQNPSVTLNVENFGNPDSTAELPVQTLRISQVIELADKRAKRRLLGEADQRLVAWDYEAKRLEVASTAASRFVAVLVAQERVALAERQLALSQSAYDIAAERTGSGTRPGYERDQAKTRVALSQIKHDQSLQDLEAARAELAATWSGRHAVFARVDGDLANRVELPDQDTLEGRLAQSPAVARWADEVVRQERAVDLQRAKAVTDPSIGGGVRYLAETDVTVGLAEVTWPIPLLDTNEHGILAARLRLSQARAEQDAARTDASQQLAVAYSRARSAAQTLSSLQDQAIPAAQAAYDASLQAYEAGQAEYLTALEAERSLLDLQNLQLDAALAYHTAIIALEQLTASAIQP